MVSSTKFRQLVLFDCNEGRLSIFKEHEKYLSQIPPNCECYIFWNDLKFPVFKNLQWVLRNYSRIYYCPSYRQQIDSSSNPDLLSFLDKSIIHFSFVLLVHGSNQSYRADCARVIQEYGNEKIKLQEIRKPFSHHLRYVIRRLRKKHRAYNHQEYLKGCNSNEQLKHKNRSFLLNNICDDDNPHDPDAAQVKIYFKRLTKRKQKDLKIYHENTRFLSDTQYPSKFTDNDEYLWASCVKVLKYGFRIDLQSILFLLLQYRMKSTHTVTVTRYFVGEFMKFLPLTAVQLSNDRDTQELITQGGVYIQGNL